MRPPKGWSVPVTNLPKHSKSVDEIVMKGGYLFRFDIEEQPSAAKARTALEDLADTAMISTLGERVPFDEPQLHGTGLKMDVLDYKNKRLISMQSYELSNMRVFGVVKRSALYVAAVENGRHVGYKTDTNIYNELIGLIKLMVKELKKK